MTTDKADDGIDIPPANPFSIGDENDDEEGALLAAAADDSDGTGDVKLTSRTNTLMKNFNDYLTNITDEGDANGSSNNNAAPTVYRDFIDVEENNVDDHPPSYEDIERELQMQGRYPKRKYIIHSFRHSKRVKRGIGMIIIAAIIIGVSVGVSTSKKNQRLPDWNQELEEQIEKEGITGDGLPGAKPELGGQMGYEDSYNNPYRPTTNTNTQPITEFHTEASSGNHHAGSGSGPYNHNGQVLNQPHHDNAHQILDGITHSSSGSSGITHSSFGSSLQQHMDWNNISRAQEFCASRDPTMQICPYEAICPLGPSGHPTDGTKNEAFGSWAPLNNDDNTWVQVGQDDPCLLYSYSHGHAPEWGLVKGGNEPQTRHIMCCQVDDTAEDSDVDRNPNLPNTQEWDPTWYSRSDGWVGQTYEQASDFCKSLGDTSDLCYYSIICPTGPNHLPYGGEIIEAGGSWAPIKDSNNGWVQVGSNDMCIRYMTLHLDTPTWGITGEGNEEITRHLPCCTFPSLPTYSPTKLDDDSVVSSEVPTPSDALPLANGEMNNYDIAAMEYKPVWFNRSTGWSGRTWNEAKNFCASVKYSSGDQMVLCPYDAVCPLGPSEMPSKGAKPELFQMWLPTLGLQGNEWVQIGSDPDTVCMTHRQVVGRQAEWGLTGEGSEEITRNIMCCAGNGRFVQQYNTQIDQPTADADTTDALATIESIYKPVEYDRQSGWEGTNYADAIIFCANLESRIPCPYETYCPNGENADPYGGVNDNPSGAWAPMMDAPNSWVQIGKVEPNEPEPSLVKPLSPLTDKEETVLNHLTPLWFDRSHGYRGTTHEEAELFCNTVIGMHLCPIEAYCPNAVIFAEGTFQGEQWAPVSGLTETDLGNNYVMIGTLDGDASSTCMPYDSLHTNPLPPWSTDGSNTELKQHVMCCEKPETINQHQGITKGMSPIWLDTKHGWSGGSHQDAQKFCNELGGKKLCPYAVYCPDGIGRQPLSGHSTDLNSQGVQYSPIFGESNEWVMIGQKDGNAATTCMLHTQLEGGEPDWGLNEERQDIKNHVLCCSF
ncbi:hypothetical protein QTG54_001656 [Skeletonema marinoi]|uniref:DUF7495 domain-containing protein n=1 Tax=Skeletonema marinoi TaxID=267567 RepID=A0AAD8YKI3_9STRA|nr:hypothetical protein QTG54_001656 [Skeletonema marinoi]